MRFARSIAEIAEIAEKRNQYSNRLTIKKTHKKKHGKWTITSQSRNTKAFEDQH